MPVGKVSPNQRPRYDNAPWKPGHVIGERFGRHVAISYAAAKKLPDYENGMLDAVIEADRIIYTLLGKRK